MLLAKLEIEKSAADREGPLSAGQDRAPKVAREQAEADADVEGKGQIWVDTATPNVLMFTNDAGTDQTVNMGAGGGDVSATSSPLNNEIAVWTDGTTIGATAGFEWDESILTAPAITATGDILGGTFIASADVGADDTAAIGYTSVLGIVITGQGSTNDITVQNDAEAEIFVVT